MLSRICPLEIRANRIQILYGLCWSNCRFEVPDDGSYPSRFALVEIIHAPDLLLIHHGNVEPDSDKRVRTVKLGGRDTGDGERMLIELNGAANDVRIVLKMIVPVSVREHEVRSAVRPSLVR